MADFVRTAVIVLAAAALCGCSARGNTSDSFEENSDVSFADASSSESADNEPQSEEEEQDTAKTTELFDVSPIVKAYKSGDTSALSQLESDIYQKACEVLDEIIDDGMSDYDKELAVHDYLVINCTYDKGSLSAIPNPSENCDNPYGALINGQAICSGYTTTFRMFMGMLGIPCGTVHASDIVGEEHAWNTVRLDGSWYYVDVTWDDPVPDFSGRPVRHTYFNISREDIEADHILPDGTPDTDSIENSFFNRSAVEISDFDEIYPLAEAALKNKTDSIVLLFDESLGVELSGYDSIDSDYYPDSKALTETIDDVWEELVRSGTLDESSDVFMRRVETDRGTALDVRFCQYG